MRWKQVADVAGMTYSHMHKIRRGQTPVTDLAARGIERALDWPQGRVGEIRRPEPKGDPAIPILDELHAVDTESYGLELADRLLEARIRLINESRIRRKSRTSDQPETR